MTITSTPAAARIAQIRSALGQRGNVGGNGAFALQLDTFRAQNAAPTTTIAPATAEVQEPAQVGVTESSETVLPDGPTTVRDSVPYAALFNEVGALHDVDPALLASVAEIESAFNPAAISSAGAQGLMQFMPATAGEMGVDSFDPASAVDGAARYLRRELDRFGSVELALAAYNAGPGAVQRHGGIPPFAETQRYVEKVLTAYESHQALESD